MRWMLASLVAGMLALHGCDACGATASASRSMETSASIGRIVAQCGAGLFHDARLVGRTSGLREKTNGFLAGLEAADFRLTIDGQPREGLQAWADAAWRIGSYAADTRHAGSVGLAYRLRLRGYNITTTTAVSDGRVEKVIDAWWTETVVIPLPPFLQRLLKKKAIIRKVPIHVCIPIRADEESDGTTRIVGTATGTADTRQFCLRRVAERQATQQLNAGLRNALIEIERRGRLAYASGSDIADVLDGIKLGINIGQRFRRR